MFQNSDFFTFFRDFPLEESIEKCFELVKSSTNREIPKNIEENIKNDLIKLRKKFKKKWAEGHSSTSMMKDDFTKAPFEIPRFPENSLKRGRPFKEFCDKGPV